MTLNPDGPPCPGNCPNNGCVEAYCSGQALERDATELARDKPETELARSLGRDGKVSGRDLVDAERGDPDALLLFDRFARMLGVAIAGFVNVFEPEHLVLGGGCRARRGSSSSAPSARPARARCRRCFAESRSRSPRAAPTLA